MKSTTDQVVKEAAEALHHIIPEVDENKWLSICESIYSFYKSDKYSVYLKGMPCNTRLIKYTADRYYSKNRKLSPIKQWAENSVQFYLNIGNYSVEDICKIIFSTVNLDYLDNAAIDSIERVRPVIGSLLDEHIDVKYVRMIKYYVENGMEGSPAGIDIKEYVQFVNDIKKYGAEHTGIPVMFTLPESKDNIEIGPSVKPPKWNDDDDHDFDNLIV